MARKNKTRDPADRIARRQVAIKEQKERIAEVCGERQREQEIAGALAREKHRREQQEWAVERRLGSAARATRRCFIALQETVDLPCDREADSAFLANLARHRRDWVRPISQWKPVGDSLLENHSSLLRHALMRYETPEFMEKAWFLEDTPEGRQFRLWFLRMTRGENIRACSPPIRLTHKAAHLFLQAPSDCTILGAMRRAQYLAMGGSIAGATEILNTALGYAQPNEAFWETALLFIANHEREMRAGQIAQLIHYLYGQVAERNPQANFGGAPARPDFSLRGRTLNTLMRDAAAYQTARPTSSGQMTWWNRSGIEEWESTESAGEAGPRFWTVTELLNSGELRQEGETMRHCVAYYSGRCREGATSIWSVRYREAESIRTVPVMTLEINTADRSIVQARGKCNQSVMSEDASPLLRTAARLVIQWADREKVSIAWGLMGWSRSYLLGK